MARPKSVRRKAVAAHERDAVAKRIPRPDLMAVRISDESGKGRRDLAGMVRQTVAVYRQSGELDARKHKVFDRIAEIGADIYDERDGADLRSVLSAEPIWSPNRSRRQLGWLVAFEPEDGARDASERVYVLYVLGSAGKEIKDTNDFTDVLCELLRRLEPARLLAGPVSRVARLSDHGAKVAQAAKDARTSVHVEQKRDGFTFHDDESGMNRQMWMLLVKGSEDDYVQGLERRAKGRVHALSDGQWPGRDDGVPLGWRLDSRKKVVPDHSLETTSLIDALTGVIAAKGTWDELLEAALAAGWEPAPSMQPKQQLRQLLTDERIDAWATGEMLLTERVPVRDRHYLSDFEVQTLPDLANEDLWELSDEEQATYLQEKERYPYGWVEIPVSWGVGDWNVEQAQRAAAVWRAEYDQRWASRVGVRLLRSLFGVLPAWSTPQGPCRLKMHNGVRYVVKRGGETRVTVRSDDLQRSLGDAIIAAAHAGFEVEGSVPVHDEDAIAQAGELRERLATLQEERKRLLAAASESSVGEVRRDFIVRAEAKVNEISEVRQDLRVAETIAGGEQMEADIAPLLATVHAMRTGRIGGDVEEHRSVLQRYVASFRLDDDPMPWELEWQMTLRLPTSVGTFTTLPITGTVKSVGSPGLRNGGEVTSQDRVWPVAHRRLTEDVSLAQLAADVGWALRTQNDARNRMTSMAQVTSERLGITVRAARKLLDCPLAETRRQVTAVLLDGEEPAEPWVRVAADAYREADDEGPWATGMHDRPREAMAAVARLADADGVAAYEDLAAELGVSRDMVRFFGQLKANSAFAMPALRHVPAKDRQAGRAGLALHACPHCDGTLEHRLIVPELAGGELLCRTCRRDPVHGVEWPDGYFEMWENRQGAGRNGATIADDSDAAAMTIKTVTNTEEGACV